MKQVLIFLCLIGVSFGAGMYGGAYGSNVPGMDLLKAADNGNAVWVKPGDDLDAALLEAVAKAGTPSRSNVAVINMVSGIYELSEMFKINREWVTINGIGDVIVKAGSTFPDPILATATISTADGSTKLTVTEDEFADVTTDWACTIVTTGRHYIEATPVTTVTDDNNIILGRWPYRYDLASQSVYMRVRGLFEQQVSHVNINNIRFYNDGTAACSLSINVPYFTCDYSQPSKQAKALRYTGIGSDINQNIYAYVADDVEFRMIGGESDLNDGWAKSKGAADDNTVQLHDSAFDTTNQDRLWSVTYIPQIDTNITIEKRWFSDTYSNLVFDASHKDNMGVYGYTSIHGSWYNCYVVMGETWRWHAFFENRARYFNCSGTDRSWSSDYIGTRFSGWLLNCDVRRGRGAVAGCGYWGCEFSGVAINFYGASRAFAMGDKFTGLIKDSYVFDNSIAGTRDSDYEIKVADACTAANGTGKTVITLASKVLDGQLYYEDIDFLNHTFTGRKLYLSGTGVTGDGAYAYIDALSADGKTLTLATDIGSGTDWKCFPIFGEFTGQAINVVVHAEKDGSGNYIYGSDAAFGDNGSSSVEGCIRNGLIKRCCVGDPTLEASWLADAYPTP
jgi:hypothetical protein